MCATLTTPKNYYLTHRVLIAAEISGNVLKVVESKDPENPILYSNKNVTLFEPNAIASHVSNSQLSGKESGDGIDSEVLQWCLWGDSQILPPMRSLVYPLLGIVQTESKSIIDHAQDAINKAIHKLDSHLATKTYLVGERLTLADICVATDLLLLFEHVIDQKTRDSSPHLVRWFLTIMNHPASLKVIGHAPKLCNNAQSGTPRNRNRSHRKSSGSQNEEKPKKSHGAPSPKPAEPSTTSGAAAESDEEKEKPKEKDPFSALPAGTFKMKDWKTTFSNNDIQTVAIPYLWQNIDLTCYSFWFCDYQYNDELKLIFMTCNLVGGMFQRLEKMRNHAFGSMCIFGENNKSSLSGVWLWRGQDLAFDLDSDLQLDYECYNWRKLDSSIETDKKLIEEYFIQKGDFDGKTLNQSKIYK